MKKTTAAMKSKNGAKEAKGGDSPSRLIDARIKDLGDWRGAYAAQGIPELFGGDLSHDRPAQASCGSLTRSARTAPWPAQTRSPLAS